jgi:carbon-monoxide dehydrogenase large subunit
MMTLCFSSSDNRAGVQRVERGWLPSGRGGVRSPFARARINSIDASAAHVVKDAVCQQIYAPVPVETSGLVVEWAGG